MTIKYGPYKLVIALAFIFLFSPITSAKTDPFFSLRGFSTPEPFTSLFSHNEASYVFLNPASTALAGLAQLKLDSGYSLLGYTFTSVTALFPLKQVTIGMGYSSDRADDIPRTTYSAGSRPHVIEGFGHNLQNAAITSGFSINKSLHFGTRIHYFNQHLDSEFGEFFSVDFGGIYLGALPFWIGLYTQNFIHTSYKWTGSGIREPVPRQFILESGIVLSNLQLNSCYNFQDLKFEGIVDIGPHVSFWGDWVLASLKDTSRYAYGIQLNFGATSLRFAQLLSIFGPSHFGTQLIGISFSL